MEQSALILLYRSPRGYGADDDRGCDSDRDDIMVTDIFTDELLGCDEEVLEAGVSAI